jgi:hypothetical protein
MPLIDAKGRLLGLNIVDAAVLAFVLLLVPVGYAAVSLFRVRPPVVEKVEPAEQFVGSNVRIRLYGRHFRPVFRLVVSHTGEPFTVTGVRLGDAPSQEHPDSAQHIAGVPLVETPTVVEFLLPPTLPPGQYDVRLYDLTQELAHIKRAFVLKPRQVVESWMEARMHFVAGYEPTILRTGDVDVTSEPSELGPPDGRFAALKEISSVTKTSGLLDGVMTVPFWVVSAQVRIPVRQDPRTSIWMYRRQPIQRGGRFLFQTPDYAIQGTIVGLERRD